MVDVIPTSLEALTILAFSIGFLLGEGGSKFDEMVKYGAGKPWYDSFSPVAQYFIALILNVSHHFQYGLASIYFGWGASGEYRVFLWWFGWGLVVADFKDYENILKRLGFSKPTPSHSSP